jgi:hypoxanthine-guanine phosphoribosyltransferase
MRPGVGDATRWEEARLAERQHVPAEIERVLLGEETIAARVRELAARISADYAKASNLVLVGVLKGSFIFLADLAAI